MDQFAFSGFSATNMMACVTDGTDIYQTDYAGNRQLIGKSLSAYSELEQTTGEGWCKQHGLLRVYVQGVSGR